MRRKGHPSRPRAITCCFFASLKTLLIPTKATALRRNQRPRASFSLAGFQVTLIGRFWVTAEVAKLTGSVIGPGEPIVLPPGAKEVGYEAELAVIIGRKCRG